MNNCEIENAEIELVLQAIQARYGWNFIHYKRSSVHRSIRRIISKYNITHISDLITMIMWNEEFMNTLLCDLSIPVSDMFRDPDFFKTLRQEIIPILKTYPFIKIWHAGCANGEEVYSLAILLTEENLYERSKIYATDINSHALENAREGVFALNKFNDYEKNYLNAGGKEKLKNYFTSEHDVIIINANLKKNISFFDHNLSSDQPFDGMNLILCRNVIIYFDQTLQKRVITLFDKSLCYGGFLCLGMKESIDFLSASRDLYLWKKKERIYRKGIPDMQEEKNIKETNEIILLVEDENSVRELAAEYLIHLGYQTLTAENGPAALEILKRGEHIDLLFTDVIMPGGMTGPELAIKARELYPNIKVLFTSGYPKMALTNNGQLSSSEQHLPKPYKFEKLGLKIREIFDQNEPAI